MFIEAFERNTIKNNLPIVDVPLGIKNLEGKVLKRTNNSFIKNVEESDSRIIQEFDLNYLKERHSSLENIEIYNIFLIYRKKMK